MQMRWEAVLSAGAAQPGSAASLLIREHALRLLASGAAVADEVRYAAFKVLGATLTMKAAEDSEVMSALAKVYHQPHARPHARPPVAPPRSRQSRPCPRRSHPAPMHPQALDDRLDVLRFEVSEVILRIVPSDVGDTLELVLRQVGKVLQLRDSYTRQAAAITLRKLAARCSVDIEKHLEGHHYMSAGAIRLAVSAVTEAVMEGCAAAAAKVEL